MFRDFRSKRDCGKRCQTHSLVVRDLLCICFDRASMCVFCIFLRHIWIVSVGKKAALSADLIM